MNTRKINYLMVMSAMLFVIFLSIFGVMFYILFWDVKPVTFHAPTKIVTNPVVAGKVMEYSQNRTKHKDVIAAVSRTLWCKVPGDGMKRFILDDEPYPSSLPVGTETDARGLVDIPIQAKGNLCMMIWHAEYRLNALKVVPVSNSSPWFEVR